MDESVVQVVDPVASAQQGASVYVPESGTSMDFSGLFGSLFGMSGYNSDNMQELMNQYMQFVRDNTDYNNAWSAEQAQKQMDFQTMSQQMAQQYNSEEAAKNRDWQQFMSSTAHQREIADLKAAGLNPVLSAMGGNGAATTSGATASSQAMSGSKGDGDQSMNGAITSILGSALNVMSSLAMKSMDAQTSLAVADRYTEMERIIEQMREDYSTWEHQNYPDNQWQTIASIVHYLMGDSETGFTFGAQEGSAASRWSNAKRANTYIDASGKSHTDYYHSVGDYFAEEYIDSITDQTHRMFDGTKLDTEEFWKKFDNQMNWVKNGSLTVGDIANWLRKAMRKVGIEPWSGLGLGSLWHSGDFGFGHFSGQTGKW